MTKRFNSEREHPETYKDSGNNYDTPNSINVGEDNEIRNNQSGTYEQAYQDGYKAGFEEGQNGGSFDHQYSGFQENQYGRQQPNQRRSEFGTGEDGNKEWENNNRNRSFDDRNR